MSTSDNVRDQTQDKGYKDLSFEFPCMGIATSTSDNVRDQTQGKG